MDKFFSADNLDIYCDDCVAAMATLPAESVDLTVTSPPYDNLRKYNGYSFDFESIAKQLYRVTKQGGVVAWVVGDATINGSETGTSFRQALYFKEIGFNLHDAMIYEKAGTGASGSNYAYWQCFEYMFVFGKGKPSTINRIADVRNKNCGAVVPGRFREGGNKEPNHSTKEFGTRTNIWCYSVGFANTSDRLGHPAPFPEQLANDHILSWSNSGDTVLDPMCGSGTTLKMALLNNRKAIGIDISEEYCALSAVRCLKAQASIGKTE
ncbi:MAG: site-specific DNA-methyltransferase [Candidatus Paceibacterota bacterium]|jgi:site-specific DNA-methyltransferase (adenine-specific)